MVMSSQPATIAASILGFPFAQSRSAERMSRTIPTSSHADQSVDDSLPELESEELVRYSRHIGLAEVGEEGQRGLNRSSISTW